MTKRSFVSRQTGIFWPTFGILVGGGAKLHHWGDGSCRLRAE
jgi:hypothetical protein